MITYRPTAEGVTVGQLEPFFVGWSAPPSLEHRVRILNAAHEVVTAWDGDALVGFITALTDGVYAAFIPLLEVVPTHQGRGIGAALTQRMVDRLRNVYSIDLVCDPDVSEFYTKLGGTELVGIGWRNRAQLDP